MAFVNVPSREIFLKIVYYGAGLCGKTANVEHVHARAPEASRGNLVSLKTESERTLFFDFMPLEVGQIRGYRVRLHLYTVPGQVFYKASRKLILKGVDGVVFVVDSQTARLEANVEALEDLGDNLAELGAARGEIPCVVQYNKRDLPEIEPIPRLRELLNPMGAPEVESAAKSGVGVMETLQAVSRSVLQRMGGRKVA
ncbi:GTP-binding protein [Polyangium jinanense]|uniref:Gliding-motility protein MglA n=1 Tax=Polyangium jinanense TaxID=2829994 RepID=A0A9X3X8R3_9BACT|nr:gliding-motility protein MglA [Polyangium jinanense]MDC3957573.1 gliding-motility protein MglA [Polyangium jinanense]MDC3984645.1 gliding-motility protein MglA [Polyangium jinanense]